MTINLKWAVVLVVLLLCIGGAIGHVVSRPATPPTISPTDLEKIREVFKSVGATEVHTVREIPPSEELIAALERAGAGQLRTVLRAVTRLEGRVQDHTVHVEHDPIEVEIPPHPPGRPDCPACDDRPSGEVVWSGGCRAEIDQAGDRRFARLLWDASASGVSPQGLGWSISSGEPFAVDELTFDEVVEPTRLPRSTSWGLGVGLWAPRASFLDVQGMASLRRSSFAQGRRWGWWAMLETSVAAGEVSSGSIGYGSPAVQLGGAGVQIGIERRGGR